jgi:hypothetical protein
LIPNSGVRFVRKTRNYAKAEDIFSREILAKANLKLPGLPVAFNSAFSMNEYAYVVCEVFNSGQVHIIPENNSYYDLFLNVSNGERDIALDKYEAGSDNTKLLFVISSMVIDSIIYSTKALQRLDFSAQVDYNNIATANGNYKVENSSSRLHWVANQIGDVSIRDFTDFLRLESQKRILQRARDAQTASRNDEIRHIYMKMQRLYPDAFPNDISDTKLMFQRIQQFELPEVTSTTENLSKKDIDAIQNALSRSE